jgi:hypothetical protein
LSPPARSAAGGGPTHGEPASSTPRRAPRSRRGSRNPDARRQAPDPRRGADVLGRVEVGRRSRRPVSADSAWSAPPVVGREDRDRSRRPRPGRHGRSAARSPPRLATSSCASRESRPTSPKSG